MGLPTIFGDQQRSAAILAGRPNATAKLINKSTQRINNTFKSPAFVVEQTKRENYYDSYKSPKWLSLAVGGTAAISLNNDQDEEEQLNSNIASASCCGIVGIIGFEDPYKILADGITVLQNRGYDSAGISTVDVDGNLTVTKVASVDGEDGRQDDKMKDAIEEVLKQGEKHSKAKFGIAHTRWATHGKKTDINAHPHVDSSGNISLVHNGTISNYRVLKKWLEGKGIHSKGETDTEVIVNVLGLFCNPDGSNFEEAFQQTVARLRGTWGLVCIHRRRPDVLMVSRHGSPLIIGRKSIGDHTGIVVASEQSALYNLVDGYVEMDENETLVLSCMDGTRTALDSKVIHQISCDSVFLSPAPYRHWTEREIKEQPYSIQRALGNLSRIQSTNDSVKLGGLDSAAESLLKIKHLTMLGCGTSFHAAEFGATLFRKLGLFESCRAEDASEYVAHEHIPDHCRSGDRAACIMSQSGETLDCMLVAKELEARKVLLFSVINVVGSALARKTNLGVYINAGREVAVASTKAFMCQSVISCLVGVWFHQRMPHTTAKKETRVTLIQHLKDLDTHVEGLIKNCQGPVKDFCRLIVNNRSMFILGKGLGYPVSLEGALKIKEISYLHAEGFGGGSLKHGPFALLSPEECTPVILLIFDDEFKEFMLNAAEQVKARGSRIVIITDLDPTDLHHLTENVWSVPSVGVITPLLAVVPLQMLAYDLACARGLNPDKPRGLAKTVTVW